MDANRLESYISETTTPALVLTALLALTAVVLLLDLAYRLAVTPSLASTVATYTWDGLTLGLVLGLAGVGLSMTYSILNFANFAHGDYLTAGAFAGWATTWAIAGYGTADLGSLILLGAGGKTYASDVGVNVLAAPLGILVGLVVAVVATIALSLFIDRAVFKPLRGAEGITVLIASIGVALALRYTIVLVWQQSKRGLTSGETNAFVWRRAGETYLQVSWSDVTLVVVTVALMLGIHLLLQTTKLGKAMRAMADNEDLARITGIPTERVVTWTWIVGGGLAGAAGYLIALKQGTLGYNVGWLLLLLIFAAVILGGIGSIYGAIGGGLIIGLTAKVSLLWLPESSFARPTAFLVMILILVLRPQGLFGGRETA